MPALIVIAVILFLLSCSAGSRLQREWVAPATWNPVTILRGFSHRQWVGLFCWSAAALLFIIRYSPR